jgi:hypothetical protein
VVHICPDQGLIRCGLLLLLLLLLLQVQQLLAASGAQPGDLLLLAAGPAALVHRTLDRVRQYVARQLGMVDDRQDCLLWITGGWRGAACLPVFDGLFVALCCGLVARAASTQLQQRPQAGGGVDIRSWVGTSTTTPSQLACWPAMQSASSSTAPPCRPPADFPMFEYNAEEERLEALHHPFTAPNPEDLAHGGDLRTARAQVGGRPGGGGWLAGRACHKHGAGVTAPVLAPGLWVGRCPCPGLRPHSAMLKHC